MSDAKTLYQQGVQAIKAGDKERGRKLLHESLSLDSRNIGGWLWFARAQKDPEKALRAVNRALRLNPDHETARKMKAKLLRATGAENSPALTTNFPKTPPNTPGRELVVVGQRRSPYILKGLLIIPAVLVVIVCVIMGIDTIQIGRPELSISLFAIAGVVALLPIAVFFQTFTGYKQKIILCENGFSLYANEENASVYLWHEIDAVKYVDAVQHRITRIGLIPIPSSSKKFKLILFQGKKRIATISDLFQQASELAAGILGRVIPPIASRYADRLRAGESIKIAGIEFEPEGVYGGLLQWRRLVAWQEIVSVSIQPATVDSVTLVLDLKNGKNFKYRKNSLSENLFVIPTLIQLMIEAK